MYVRYPRTESYKYTIPLLLRYVVDGIMVVTCRSLPRRERHVTTIMRGPYRGTSFIRKRPPLGLYSRPRPRSLR